MSSATKVGEVECFELVSTIKAKGYKVPFPPALKVESSEMSVTVDGKFARSGQLSKLQDSTKMIMKVLAVPANPKPDAPPLTIESEVLRNASTTRSPVAAKAPATSGE